MRRLYGLNKGLDVTTMPQDIKEQLMSAVGALTPAPVVVNAVKAAPEKVADKVVEVVSQPAMRKAGDKIAQMDDAVQTAIRQKLYGERPDGTYGTGNLAGARALVASILHGSGKGLSDDAVERAVYLAGTRGLQAGAITGAGAGLASLMSDNEPERGQIVIR